MVKNDRARVEDREGERSNERRENGERQPIAAQDA
jgi:hypothetical protein